MTSRSVVLLSLLLFSLSGCIGLGKHLSQLPPELQMKEVARTDSASPFAVSRDGKFATIHEKAIEIISPDGQIVKTGQIVGQRPTILSFSPNGTTLFAALPTATGSSLWLLTLDGKLLAESTVPGRVTAALWRGNQRVEAAALDIRRSSEGTQLTSILYDWDNSGTPVATTLSSVNLGTQLSKLPDALLLNTLNMSLSPYGDEIAYSVVKVLPQLSYQSVITRYLESGSEHEVTRTSLGSGGPIYAPDGDTLLVGDSRSVTRRVTIPDGREIYAWPSQGSYPAISPSGKYLFLDRHLYRDGQTFATFPEGSRAEFLPDGSGLLLSYGSRLYLVSGLYDHEQPVNPAINAKLLELRKLRSQGVISEKQYRARRDKLKGQK